MTPRERAERALRHAPVMPAAKPALLTFVEMEIVEAEREAVRDFARGRTLRWLNGMSAALVEEESK